MALDKKTLAFIIALMVALTESLVIFGLVYWNLQGLSQRVSELERQANAAAELFERVAPSVATVKCVKSDGLQMLGSAFFVNNSSLLVTSYHVVANTTSITIVLHDKSSYNATCIGGDIYTDLAVLKLENITDAVRALSWGNSSRLKVGETIYVVGSPFGLTNSLAIGTISGTGRLIQLGELGVPYPYGAYAMADMVQFDATVAPGSSGSPLFNSKGEVVGVVLAMRTEGIALAASSNIVSRIVSSLILNGHYDHPWLGVGYDPEYVGGLKVVYVFPDSPANRTGLLEGDVIVAVDGVSVRDAADFITYIEKNKSPGDVIVLTVERKGLHHLMQLELGTRPCV